MSRVRWRRGIWTLWVIGALTAQAELPSPAAADSPPADLSTLQDLRVLLLAPASGRAIVQEPGGRLFLLEAGGSVPGSGLLVEEVLPDRLVLSAAAAGAKRAPGVSRSRRRLYWLYRDAGRDGRPRVERIDRDRPESLSVRRPWTSATDQHPIQKERP